MNYCNAARGHTTEDELEGASGSGQSETTSGMKHRVALGLKPAFQAFQLLLLLFPRLLRGFSKIAPEFRYGSHSGLLDVGDCDFMVYRLS